MPKIAIYAKLTAVPGKRDELIEMLQDDVARAMDDVGTEVYVFHADKRDPDVVWAYELYTDKDALRVHVEWAQHSLERIRPILAGEPLVELATPVGGKGLSI